MNKFRDRVPGVQKSQQVITGVAWYSPGQYQRLLEVADDRKELAENHEGWLKRARQLLANVMHGGMKWEKAGVGVEDLQRCCLMTSSICH